MRVAQSEEDIRARLSPDCRHAVDVRLERDRSPDAVHADKPGLSGKSRQDEDIKEARQRYRRRAADSEDPRSYFFSLAVPGAEAAGRMISERRSGEAGSLSRRGYLSPPE